MLHAQSTGPQYAHHAVVMIPSHGGSGIVIATSRQRTYLLSAAHMFEGKDANKAIRLQVPVPRPEGQKQVGIWLVALDRKADLALLEMNYGPLPYLAPVAPINHQLRRKQWLLSVGYDEMKKPPRMRWTKYAGSFGHLSYTETPPWHGRSGGALLDMQTGYTVGVVSGYERPYPQGRGRYVSLSAIHAFLQRVLSPKVIEQRVPM